MKKPARRATPESDADPIVIKNPFLVAKLEKAAQRMGCSMNQAVVFFVNEGFDKPSQGSQATDGNRAESARAEGGDANR